MKHKLHLPILGALTYHAQSIKVLLKKCTSSLVLFLILCSNNSFSQKRDWAFFDNTSAGNVYMRGVTFTGAYNKPDLNQTAIKTRSISNNITAVGVNSFNSDDGNEIVGLVATTSGTCIYVANQYLSTVPEFDDELGIVPIPTSPNIFNLIIGDKIYKLDISNQALSNNPIDIKTPINPSPAAANVCLFEGGSCSSIPDVTAGTYKVYIIQSRYEIPTVGNNTSITYELVETVINYSSFAVVSQNIITTFETGTLSVVNGLITGFSNKTYSEMEYLNGRVAWGENSNIHVMDLTGSTYIKYAASYRVTGLEFNPKDPKELWISYTYNGLAKWDVLNSTSPSPIAHTSDYCYSQIEAGRNGDLYVISNSTYKLRGYYTQIFSYGIVQQNLPILNNMIPGGNAYLGGCYNLPDQIDGWDYKRSTSQNLTSATFSPVANTCNDFTITVSSANSSGFKCFYDVSCTELAGAFTGASGIVTAYRKYPSIWVKYMDKDNNSEGNTTIKLDLIVSYSFDVETEIESGIWFDQLTKTAWGCLSSNTNYTNNTNFNNSCVASTWLWDLGNNTTSSLQIPNAAIYSYPGAYDITLVAIGSTGCLDMDVIKLYIDENNLQQLPDQCGNNILNLESSEIGLPKGGNYYIDGNLVVNNGLILSSIPNLYSNPHSLSYTVCGATTSCNFNIKQPPSTPSFTSSTNNTPVNLCPGTSVVLTTSANDARWYSTTPNNGPYFLHTQYNGSTSETFSCIANNQYIPDNITYRIFDYDANGCLSDPSAQIRIQYSLAPYAYSTTSYLTVCKNSAGGTDLYACENDPIKPPSYCDMQPGGQNIQWYKNGILIANATNPTLSINNSSIVSATYYYITTSKFGACPIQSANYNIHVPDVPVITAVPAILQPNGNCTLNFTNAADFQSINWYYNGIIISNNAVINVTTPGKYTAEGISTCGNYVADITIGMNCGNNVVQRTITVNTTYNTPTTLFDVTINNGATLTVNSTTLTMQNCARITVKTGGSLVVNGSKLIGCTEWAGITVEDGGSLTINSQNGVNSEISDAYAGIYYKKINAGNGTFNVQYCDFGNNTSHIILIDKTNTSTISNCNFYSLNNSPSCANIANIPSLQNSSIRKQVYIQACNDVHFTQCVFKGQPNVGTAFSRYAVEGYNLTTSNANYNLEIKEFDFNGTYTEAIHLNNCKNVNIEGRGSIDNIYGYMDIAIHTLNGSKVTVKKTRIGDYTVNPAPITPPITNGILLDQTDECTVNNCKFHYCKNGMQYYNSHSNQATTNITENVFFHNQFGLVMASNNHPNICGNFCNNTNTNTMAVTLGCNNFLLNKVGVFGCGALPQIGTFNSESGNIFKWSNNSNNNIDWDFLWDDLTGNNPQKSIYLDNTYYIINNANPVPYAMNSTANFVSTGFIGVTSPNSPGCRNTSRAFAPIKSRNIDNSEHKSDILVSPNPFGNTFNIKLNNYSFEEIDIYNIELLDILGRSVLPKITFSSESLAIDCSQIPAGTYILRCTSSNLKQSITKLIKVAD